MRWPTDDDDGCASQQCEQSEEHHLVAVDEAVQGVAPLHGDDWSSSCWERAVDETTGCQDRFRGLRTHSVLTNISCSWVRLDVFGEPCSDLTREMVLTLHSSTVISDVNQSDWDDKSLPVGSAAYGNRSGERCLGVHSADGVLREAGVSLVHLLLLDNNVGRSRHHLQMWRHFNMCTWVLRSLVVTSHI